MVGKALVAVAAEEDGRGMGRIRLRRIAGCLSGELGSLCRRSYPTWQPSVHTDGWEGYAGLREQRIPP